MQHPIDLASEAVLKSITIFESFEHHNGAPDVNEALDALDTIRESMDLVFCAPELKSRAFMAAGQVAEILKKIGAGAADKKMVGTGLDQAEEICGILLEADDRSSLSEHFPEYMNEAV